MYEQLFFIFSLTLTFFTSSIPIPAPLFDDRTEKDPAGFLKIAEKETFLHLYQGDINTVDFHSLANLYEMNQEWVKAEHFYQQALYQSFRHENKLTFFMAANTAYQLLTFQKIVHLPAPILLSTFQNFVHPPLPTLLNTLLFLRADLANGIGICQKEQGRFHEAVESHQVAKYLYQSFNHSSGIAGANYNLSHVYLALNNPQLCLRAVKEAVSVLEKSYDDLTPYALFYETLADAFELNGKDELAKKNYLKSLELSKALNKNPNLIASVCISLGNLFSKQNKINQARAYWNEALNYLHPEDDKELILSLKKKLTTEPKEIKKPLA